MSDTTFITGATGFVGSAVARKLIGKGHRLRALVRRDSARSNLNGLEVEIIEGDLLDPKSYAEALQSCKNLFHVAADYRIWVKDAEAMNRVNVEGTRALMLAALDAGIERVVYTSSVATLGLRSDGTPADENTPVSYRDMIGVYKQSKFRAEEEVARLAAQYHLPAVIVNPSTPVGPRDIRPTPTGKIIVDALSGMMPAYVDTGLNIVHVDDVAEGHMLALEKGKIGERYILGGTNLTLSEILRIIAEIGGFAPPKIKIPHELLYPVAAIMEFVAETIDWEPLVTKDALRMAEHKMWFSSKKAQEELGYTYRPAYDALCDAIEWFQSHWYC
ncbi:MAG: NAD-dependent epimerase/dehydratase family protein [Alphaproteobacteria bacterium]|nr:NAD-dependent epimerase/dehydratase family protein [Alphaproteobacteria bacterium]